MPSTRQKVMERILNYLPSADVESWVSDDPEEDLSFFFNPSNFPVGEDLGGDRESWVLGPIWSDGLETTCEPLEVISFEWMYESSEFKGVFSFEESVVQVLGDCDPVRGLSKEELDFIKSSLPETCRLFLVGVYRPETTRETKSGKPALGLDCFVGYYHKVGKPRNKRGLNSLQRLAKPSTTTSSSSSEPVQNGSQKGRNFVENLLK